MKMPKYRVHVIWEVGGWHEIEADSADEAEGIVGAKDYPLPENGEYIPGSDTVDYSLTEEL